MLVGVLVLVPVRVGVYVTVGVFDGVNVGVAVLNLHAPKSRVTNEFACTITHHSSGSVVDW